MWQLSACAGILHAKVAAAAQPRPLTLHLLAVFATDEDGFDDEDSDADSDDGVTPIERHSRLLDQARKQREAEAAAEARDMANLDTNITDVSRGTPSRFLLNNNMEVGGRLAPGTCLHYQLKCCRRLFETGIKPASVWLAAVA